MPDSTDATLVVGHPGHELLVYGWLQRARPVVHVLTDGSGHAGIPRLGATAGLLQRTGARRGAIFGRLTDREAYALILERNTPLLFSLVAELASDLARRRTRVVVCDASEGYNPVHDLCRLVLGAAMTAAQLDAKQYEYCVVDGPDRFDRASSEVASFELGEEAFESKMRAAREYAQVKNEVNVMIERHGEQAFRRESFRLVSDWTVFDHDCPAYERFGEERIAAGCYRHVIRHADHMMPLRDALLAWVEAGQCVS
jgi:hypothetical protein